MSEQDKTIVEVYCKKMDIKYNNLLKVCYALIVAILAAGAVQFITFGEVKSQVSFNTGRLNTVWKDYIPTMFLEGFVQNQNYQTEEIVATMEGDKARIREINKKYLDFQKTMINQMIQMRGGTSSATRSIKTEKNIGGSK